MYVCLQLFKDCACIGDSATAVPGLCESSCKMMFPFIANTAIISLMSSIGIIPYLIVKLRYVLLFSIGFIPYLIVKLRYVYVHCK